MYQNGYSVNIMARKSIVNWIHKIYCIIFSQKNNYFLASLICGVRAGWHDSNASYFYLGGTRGTVSTDLFVNFFSPCMK